MSHIDTWNFQVASNGIPTHDLCDASEMLYQLSCEATQLGPGSD